MYIRLPTKKTAVKEKPKLSADELPFVLTLTERVDCVLEEHQLVAEETGTPQQPRRSVQRTDAEPHHANHLSQLRRVFSDHDH